MDKTIEEVIGIFIRKWSTMKLKKIKTSFYGKSFNTFKIFVTMLNIKNFTCSISYKGSKSNCIIFVGSHI